MCTLLPISAEGRINEDVTLKSWAFELLINNEKVQGQQPFFLKYLFSCSLFLKCNEKTYFNKYNPLLS